jgi:hypothetical protein
MLKAAALQAVAITNSAHNPKLKTKNPLGFPAGQRILFFCLTLRKFIASFEGLKLSARITDAYFVDLPHSHNSCTY